MNRDSCSWQPRVWALESDSESILLPPGSVSVVGLIVSPQNICCSPYPVNGTLFGNRVSADVKLK